MVSKLDEVIVPNREALGLFPVTPYGPPLCTPFPLISSLDISSEAIVLVQEALAPFSPKHSRRSLARSHLATCLFARFKQLGDMGELDDAIDISREALELLPRERPS